jgi:DNA-binding beta-propeller fold protein YncE
MTPVSGSPFGAVITADGRWAFVSLGDTVAVLRLHPSPSLVNTIGLPGDPGEGETLTSDGRYLLVAAGSGVVVINVARAERRAAGMVAGTLSETKPGGSATQTSATQVVVSPGNRFAFVTLEFSREAAVFNLGRALADGFAAADFIGNVPLGTYPVGMAFAPGGRWLYATSELSRPGSATDAVGDGSLSVISVARAQTDPAASVVATVPAGCVPVRVITTAGGAVVWVTARASDALLGYSAAALRADPSHALRADVRVGEAPVGLAAVRGGSRIVVADSNRFGSPGAPGNLAVVNVPAALARHRALLGYLRAGQFPRQLALTPGGGTLYVTNYDSGQMESVAVGTLP